MLKEYLSTLASKFREKLGTTEKINAQDFADKIDEVYEAGKELILDQDTSIKKALSDTAIVIATNILDVPHNLSVQLSSDAITDFSTVNLYKTGINLWGGELERGTFSVASGDLNPSTTRVRSKDYVYLPAGTYRMTLADSNMKIVVYVYDRDGNFKPAESLTSWSANNKLQFSVVENRKIKFGISYSESTTILVEDVEWIMLSHDLVTEYEQYYQQPITVNGDGTAIIPVEGGALTLVTEPKEVNISLEYNCTASDLDDFWDKFQDYGNRTSYNYGFSGAGWGKETFKPKYDITPSLANYMFCLSGMSRRPVKMVDVEKECNVKFDFSKVTNFNYTFANCLFSQINEIDLSRSNITSVTDMFYHGYYTTYYLETIDGLILAETTPVNSTMLGYCGALIHVGFKGVLGKSLNMKQSTKLDKETITALMSILSDNTTGTTLTLSKTAVQNAFETSEGAADGNKAEEWTALVAAKSNWTITLS